MKILEKLRATWTVLKLRNLRSVYPGQLLEIRAQRERGGMVEIIVTTRDAKLMLEPGGIIRRIEPNDQRLGELIGENLSSPESLASTMHALRMRASESPKVP